MCCIQWPCSYDSHPCNRPHLWCPSQSISHHCLCSSFRPSGLKESPPQVQLRRMQASLDKAKNLNMWYQNDHDAQRSNEEGMGKIRQQAEVETADVIVSLQEELSMLQHRVQESDINVSWIKTWR
uniref:Uncharacterized protein n=1 Tax=Opuntia streptacantha TaxID=393608 RepID=A0A7C9DEY1_OPUST